MKTILMLTLLAFCCAPPAFAQSTRDDFPRYEFYGGFIHSRREIDVQDANAPLQIVPGDRLGFNGFETSFTRNVNRGIGLTFGLTYDRKVDFSRLVFPCPNPPCLFAPRFNYKGKANVFQFLAGVQFKNNSRTARLKPSFRARAGVARLSERFIPNPEDPDPPLCAACIEFGINQTAFTLDLGGGIDLRLNRSFDLRLLQLDYNPTRFGGDTQHNVRVGIGLGIH
jgi:opacity protein-like surface antigen